MTTNSRWRDAQLMMRMHLMAVSSLSRSPVA